MRTKTILIVIVVFFVAAGATFTLFHHPKDTPSTTSPQPTSSQKGSSNNDASVPSIAFTGIPTATSCQFTFTPSVTDNQPVEKIEFFVNDQLQYVTYSTPFTFTWATAAVPDGTYHIKATAYNNAHNSTSAVTSVEVGQPPEGCAPNTQTINTTVRPPTRQSGISTAAQTNSGSGSSNTPGTPDPSDHQSPTTPTNLAVSFNAATHFNQLSWNASADAPGVEYQVLRGGQQIATTSNPRYFDLQISDGHDYNDYQIFAVDPSNNVSAGSNKVSIRLAPQTVWNGEAPSAQDSDPAAVEVGMKFTPHVYDGQAIGVRFYKDSGNGGTHTGTLWQWNASNNTGTSLATTTFSDETASGWQTAYFDTPVTLSPDHTYVVSYYAPQGSVSNTGAYFNTSHNSPYLSARLTAGSYYAATYTSGQGFPDQDACCSLGYGVDIAFAPPELPDQEPLTAKWATYYNQWSHGPQIAAHTYPIATWQQWAGREFNGVKNGITYQNMGIQYDVGLFGWPAAAPEQIEGIAETNWKAFGSASSDRENMDMDGVTYATTQPNGQYLKGYLIDDEPDMNKVNYPPGSFASAPNTESYANAVRAADPTRPTVINFGKPMAIDRWGGYTMIDGASALSDLRQYCRAGDIVSGDYYGWTDPYESTGYHGAWTYGKVIDNMRKHCGDDKPIWGFVETSKLWTTPDCDDLVPSPAQLEQAIWSMVIHGANGIEYFGQQFCGGLFEDAFLADAPMKARMEAINAKLQTFAPLLNATSLRYAAKGTSDNSDVPIDTLAKQSGTQTYIFAQAGGSDNAPNSASVNGTIYINIDAVQAEVVGESRTVPIVDGRIVDSFSAYQVHVYKITP